MKNLIQTLVILLGLVIYPAWLLAGTESSGGGGAAVCRDVNRKIISAQILDLYEGAVRFGYDIPQSEAHPLDQLNLALSKIPHATERQLVKQATAEIMGLTSFLPGGVGLAPTTDLGSEYGVVVPDGCLIEPVGFYENNGILKVSRSVFNALTPTDKAAFILHEGIYKIARNTSDKKDSASSRQLVAALFSNNVTPDQISRLLKNVFFQNEFLSPDILSPIALVKPQKKYTLSFKKVSSAYTVSVGLGCLNSGPKYIDTIRIISGSGSTEFMDTNAQNPCQSLFILADYELAPFDKGAVIGDYEIFDDQGKLLASGSVKQYGSRWWAIPLLRNYMELPIFPNP